MLGIGVAASAAAAETAEITVQRIDQTGLGAAIGTLSLADTPGGLRIVPALHGLSPGEHGFHVHAHPDCGPGEQNGKTVAGLAAGGHFDPAATRRHLGP